MPLDDDQKKKVENWMNSKGVSGQCKKCGKEKITVGDIVTSKVISKIKPKGGSLPMVQLICLHCGNIELYLAGPIGIM